MLGLCARYLHGTLRISDQGHVLQTGRIVLEGKGEELLESDP